MGQDQGEADDSIQMIEKHVRMAKLGRSIATGEGHGRC